MPVAVRRPKAIVFDILGTASKSGFLERILFPFLKLNLENYVNTHWSKRDFVKLYNRILEQSKEFHNQEPSTPIVLGHDTPQGKQSLMNFINFVTDNQINAPAVTQLRFKVWFEGYQQSKLRTPIYSDVPARVKQWFSEGIKFFVFSNTWVEAQKALLRNTNHGDLTNLISGHYDNDFGLLTEADSWRRLCNEIHMSPQDVLFLTKSPVEGRAASDVGIAVVLVLTHRHNVKAVSREDRQRFPYVRTLNDLGWAEAEAGASQVGAGSEANLPSSVPAPPPLSNPSQGPMATAMSAPSTNVAASGATSGTSGAATSGVSGAGSSHRSHHSSSATGASGSRASGSHAGSSSRA